jgi:hypothetical protein
MFQILEFDNPIPSCEIHEVHYNNGLWKFRYAVNTPIEITNENQIDLIVYEFIADLSIRIGEGQHKDAVNIHFKTLDEYLLLLESQLTADLIFRKRWLEKNPNAKVKKFATKNLENRDYNINELRAHGIHFISFLIENDGKISTFAAV